MFNLAENFIAIAYILPLIVTISIPLSAASTGIIEVGTFTYSTASSYKNLAVTTLYPTVTIPLKKSQASALYQSTVVFSNM